MVRKLALLVFVPGCSVMLGMESSYDLRPPSTTPASTASNDPVKECVPGDFRCSGADLESCDAGRFRLWKTCENAEKCSATGGNCDGLYCTPAQHRCRGDALERCSDDLSQFVLLNGCGVGLCDAIAKRCNVCLPQSRSCADGTTLTECAADGLGTSSSAHAPFAQLAFLQMGGDGARPRATRGDRPGATTRELHDLRLPERRISGGAGARWDAVRYGSVRQRLRV